MGKKSKSWWSWWDDVVAMFSGKKKPPKEPKPPYIPKPGEVTPKETDVSGRRLYGFVAVSSGNGMLSNMIEAEARRMYKSKDYFMRIRRNSVDKHKLKLSLSDNYRKMYDIVRDEALITKKIPASTLNFQGGDYFNQYIDEQLNTIMDPTTTVDLENYNKRYTGGLPKIPSPILAAMMYSTESISYTTSREKFVYDDVELCKDFEAFKADMVSKISSGRNKARNERAKRQFGDYYDFVLNLSVFVIFIDYYQPMRITTGKI